MDKQRASTVYIGKGWANDKAVCPPYTFWRFKTAKAVLLQVHRILVYNDEYSAWERYESACVNVAIAWANGSIVKPTLIPSSVGQRQRNPTQP